MSAAMNTAPSTESAGADRAVVATRAPVSWKRRNDRRADAARAAGH